MRLYKVKRKGTSPVLRAFRRDLKTQTYGTRFGGLDKDATFSSANIQAYLHDLGAGAAKSLGPLTENDPSEEDGTMEVLPGIRRVVRYFRLVLKRAH